MIFEVGVVVMIVYLLFMVLSMKVESNENMLSGYECGFDSVMGSRVSFSFRFFLISILFLVFDVEITLLIPVPYMMMGEWQSLGVLVFLSILLAGLLYEYYNGVLVWIETENV
uniref:NADH dehydrogenase subunit 3 n=1 Tax=Brachypelma albiceps TaxID=1750704 RepID=UPI001FF3DED6|nr:NADH dehydrogenase subunit 3 [Brachypelma albiceps]UIO59248.1 NADH dehydrogenase subunit 3 [Brachypelma albiceps]